MVTGARGFSKVTSPGSLTFLHCTLSAATVGKPLILHQPAQLHAIGQRNHRIRAHIHSGLWNGLPRDSPGNQREKPPGESLPVIVPAARNWFKRSKGAHYRAC
jgi:hypothetical protein